MPQPYFVPVRPTCSRITQSSGVVGSTSILCDCPLMVSATICPPAHPPVSFSCRQLARDFLLARFSQARVGRQPSDSDASGTSQFRERSQMSQRENIADRYSLQTTD